VLDALARSLGFCSVHGAFLASGTAGGFQLTVVHASLVRRLRAALQAPSRGRRPDGSVRLAGPGACPVCHSRQESVDRNLFWLAQLLAGRPQETRYGKPGLLCLPHLRALAIASRQAEPGRHGQRDAGGDRRRPPGRLPARRLASVRRDRGHDDRRLRGRGRRPSSSRPVPPAGGSEPRSTTSCSASGRGRSSSRSTRTRGGEPSGSRRLGAPAGGSGLGRAASRKE
jgi:hypothetical protein